jgi:Putative prokaryotic signal transducing protein
LKDLAPQSGDRDRSREPLVRIAVAENPATAELVRQELADAGIQCMAKNTDALGVMSGSLWSSPFSVEMFVLSGDEAAAQQVLAEKGYKTDGPIALPSKRRYKRRSK